MKVSLYHKSNMKSDEKFSHITQYVKIKFHNYHDYKPDF